MKNRDYKEIDNFIFFWGGIYSQWALKDIIINGITFNCCEQFMMYSKAKMFNDIDALNKIMMEKDPYIQKKIGRSVKGFDDSEWHKVSRDVVYRGNYAKFTQHKNLKQMLLETGTKIIVEASPYDKIWGIGMSSTNPHVTDMSKWKGKNWLGEAIMKVREELIQEVKYDMLKT